MFCKKKGNIVSNTEKKKVGTEPIYDARTLGAPKFTVLGLQHMFAMFGATILVPVLTGLDVSTTLLFAGLGTLLFHLISGGSVPAFLGSSFAFIAGYFAIAPNQEPELLPYACFGVACASVIYFIIAGLFRAFGISRVMRFFPPIVTGPIIIAIGLNLSSSAINNCCDTLVDRSRSYRYRSSCKHLGQGHDKDHTYHPRRARLIHRSGSYRQR